MIDLEAIKKRIAEADELRKVSMGEWPLSGGVGDDAVEDRKELVDEVERLQEALGNYDCPILCDGCEVVLAHGEDCPLSSAVDTKSVVGIRGKNEGY